MKNTNMIGLPVGIGIIVGTVVFALTEQPIWIAIGIVVGAAIGAYYWRTRDD